MRAIVDDGWMDGWPIKIDIHSLIVAGGGRRCRRPSEFNSLYLLRKETGQEASSLEREFRATHPLTHVCISRIRPSSAAASDSLSIKEMA